MEMQSVLVSAHREPSSDFIDWNLAFSAHAEAYATEEKM
jgi:hypothetical protein